MDGFNRGFVLAVAALSAAASFLLLVVTLDLVPPSALGGGWAGDQLRELDGLRGGDRAVAVALLSIITVGAGTLAVIEAVVPQREVTATDGEGLRFGISRGGIGAVVEYVCQDISGIGEVTPTIKGSSRGLLIDCVTTLEPRYNPIEVGQRLRSRVKSSIEAAVGIPVREVFVHVRPSPGMPGSTP
jgi:hypothetical protein